MSKNILLYGTHVVKSVLQANKRTVHKIISSDTKFLKIYDKLFNTEFLDNKSISRLLPEGAIHSGYAIYCSPKKLTNLNYIIDNKEKFPSVFILDQITDPHNIGAIIRSAVNFNINALILPEFNSVIDSPIVAKTSSGAIENINIVQEINLVSSINKLKNADYWIFGMDGKAKQSIKFINKFQFKAIILGSEGDGIRPLVSKSCDELIKINSSGNVESLNVSNAAAICMHEIFNN